MRSTRYLVILTVAVLGAVLGLDTLQQTVRLSSPSCAPPMRECDAAEESGPKCYPEQWFCDGYPDCQDRSDEPATCQRLCLENEFVCKTGKCLPRAYLCDGNPDCGRLPNGNRDLSDEDPDMCKLPLKCEYNEYPCAKTAQCIPLFKFCDGAVDCGDGSDEHSMCHVEDKTTAATCEYGAAMTIDGVKCYCAKNKFLNKEGRCEWVNRCERAKNGLTPVCSQGCTDNKNGSFTCSCFDPRLKLKNETNCVLNPDAPDPSFAILTRKKLFAVQNSSMSDFSSMPRPLGKAGAITLAFQHPDFPKATLPVLCTAESPTANNSYLTCGTVEKSGTESTTKSYVIDFYLPDINMMLFDNIGNNWIFTDLAYYIFICRHDSVRITKCRTIATGEMGNIKDMKYDGLNGQLFVADEDFYHQGIWRIDVATGERNQLMKQPTTAPVIAIDPFTEFLYYVDSSANVIRAIDYNGNYSRIAVNGEVAMGVKFIDYAESKLILTLKDDRVFLVDILNPAITNWKEMTPPTNGGVVKNIVDVVHFRKNEHAWKTNGKNVCKQASCDDICLGPKGCLCQDGLAQQENKCLFIKEKDLKNKELLVLAQLRPARLRILGFDDKYNATEVGIPAILGAKRPSAFTYDPKSQQLIIFDLKRHSILIQKLSESMQSKFTVHGLNGVMNCEGMAYDQTSDNLYMTDQNRKMITVARLSNLNTQKIIVSGNMSNPRAIVVHVQKSYLFWGSWSENDSNKEGWPAMIERSKLDGSQRKTLVSKNAMWINGLTLDVKNDFLYWCDAYRNVIERIRWNGADREVVVQGADKLSHPYGLAYFDNHIFFTEFKRGGVKRVNVNSPGDVQEIFQFPATLFEMAVFKAETPNVTSPCSSSSNNCEHFCFASSCKGTVGCEPVKCACADGNKLIGKGKCVKDSEWVDPFGCDHEMQFTCAVSKKCIQKTNLCDGDDDCGDGSDEDPNGACKDYKCVGNKFQCDGTTCIPMSFVCDGKSDCADGTDEWEKTCKTPPIVKCSSDEFRCSKTKCIPIRQRCNNQKDCENGDDEKDCPRNRTCEINEFRCGNGFCIKQFQVCDGKRQCLDGLDEAHCDEEQCIPGREFKCADGKSGCLDMIFRCDGVPDCADESDESGEYCKELTEKDPDHKPYCGKMNQFMCADGKCLRSFQLCDGFADCLTAEDETACPPTVCESNTELSCKNGKKCISKQLECDGFDDCGDNSDEEHCISVRIDAADQRCQNPMYKCDGLDYKCISDKQLCDGTKDCELGDDEGMWCSFNCTQESDLGCSHTCRATPSGPICSCPESHYLEKDGVTCSKKDPCRFGQCSQYCTPHGSGHFCYCEDGFKLGSDNFSCVSEDPEKPFLIFSNRHEIRMIQSKFPGSTPLISNLVNAIALDFRYLQNGSLEIYWTDLSTDKIYAGLVEQRSIQHVRTIVSYGVFNAEGIAVDWITGNIYWIDSTLHSIQVVNNNGSKRATVLSDGMGNARALAIDMVEGLMFWTDWQESQPRIERATLAGNHRSVIWKISNVDQAGWPNGIACDMIAKRVYWVDAKSDSIHSVTYDGRDHVIVFRDAERLGHAFGIDVYEGHVYFSDWRTNTISKVDKWKGGNISVIERVSTQPFSLKIVHKSKQKMQLKNSCTLEEQMKCSGICLIDGKNKAACQCTNLQAKTDDGCVDIDQSLLVITKNSIRGFSTTPPHPHAFPLVSGKQFEQIRAVGIFNNRLQVLDALTNLVALVNLTGPADDEVLASGSDLYGASGMAVDPLVGNTYVSVSTEGVGRIEVTSADGTAKRVLVESSMLSGMKLPRDIMFMNGNKRLYWFDDSTKPASFFTMTAAGDDAKKLTVNATLFEKLYNPVVDQFNSKIYWISKGRVIQYDPNKEKISEIGIPGGDGNVSAIAVDNQSGDILIGEFVRFANKTTVRRLAMKGTKASQQGSVILVPIHSSEKYLLATVSLKRTDTLPEKCESCGSLCLSSSANSFECVCSQGFFLEAGECKSPGKRVFYASDDGTLHSVGWYKDPKTGRVNQMMRAHSLHNSVGKKRIVRIAVDAKRGLVYALTRQNEVWQCATNGSFSRIVYSTSTHRIAAITVDRVTGNLLVSARESQTTKGAIVLVDPDRHSEGMYAMIVEDAESVPYEIAVDPPRGKLFWASVSCIKSSNYAGNDTKCIVRKSQISAIAIDEVRSRLCYVDSEKAAVDCVDYNGENEQRNVAMFKPQGLGEPVNFAFNGDELFFYDKFNMSGSITRGKIQKDGTFLLVDSVVKMSPRQKLRVNDLDVMDVQSTVLFTACSNNNGGCEHLCVTTAPSESDSDYRNQKVQKKCVCVHSVPGDDGTCVPSRKFVALASHQSIDFISPGIGAGNPPNRQITSDKCTMSKTVSIAADASRGRIYFADFNKLRISSVNFDGTACVVIAEDVGVVSSMAYDEVHRELYFVRTFPASIWRIDVADNNLEAYPVEPRLVLTLTIQDRPRHIAIDPCRMLIFFTNNAFTGSVIERVYYSGFKRELVIQEDVKDLRGLTLDLTAHKLYFSDAKDFKLSRCDYDGTHREMVVSNTEIASIHPFELAVYDNEILFTDWVRRGVGAINMLTGTENRTLSRSTETPVGLVVVDVEREYCTSDPCFGNTMNCEDYCRLRADGQPTCACNGERRLNADNRTCSGEVEIKKCAENEFKCVHSDQCINYEETCDGYNDCPIHDDEDEIYCSTRNCRPGYFSCGNGLCISESKRCNRVNDCSNFADETNCTCSSEEFQCTSGVCIPSKARCDHTQDCADASDEIGCPFRNCSELTEFGMSGLINCPTTSQCILPAWKCDGRNDCYDGWDEKDCLVEFDAAGTSVAPKKCEKHQFACMATRTCMPIHWRCDGQVDCGDGSDELNCAKRKCSSLEFMCRSTGECIPVEKKCDGGKDCSNGEDEVDCDNECDASTNSTFRCTNHRCIPMAWRCDGTDDCMDNARSLGSDELECGEGKTSFHLPSRCADESCDVACELTAVLCDGIKDCHSGFDEQNCASLDRSCKASEWMCNSGQCIDSGRLCDASVDCIDGSDEWVEICSLSEPPKRGCPNGWSCVLKNGTIGCLMENQLCDGRRDCMSGIDEQCHLPQGNCSSTRNSCEQHWNCQRKAGFEKCSCDEGYHLSPYDQTSCLRSPSCPKANCSHFCIDRRDIGHQCFCAPGYILSDNGKDCRRNDTIEPEILLIYGHRLKLFDMAGHAKAALLSNMTNGVALDYDIKSDLVYWTDVTNAGNVAGMTSLSNQPNTYRFIASLPTKGIDGIAVDWLGRNIYYTDRNHDAISVCDMRGRFNRVLLKGTPLNDPRAIVLDPLQALLFWTDWGASAHIGRMNMDGTNEQIILQDRTIRWPNALAVDSPAQRLYFGDAHRDFIASCNYDGSKRRMVLRNRVRHIFALSVFEDFIYWTDWHNHTLERAHKITGEQHRVLIHDKYYRPMGFKIIHPSLQMLGSLKTAKHPCSQPARCDNLCIPARTSGDEEFTCMCAQGFRAEGRSCKSECKPNDFICTKTYKCIASWWRCDGQDDCGDGEDEGYFVKGVCPPFPCDAGQFACKGGSNSNATCLYASQLCDGKKNCPLGDDEETEFCSNFECTESQFKCGDKKKCIPLTSVCDKTRDCEDGSDEKECEITECGSEFFACVNQTTSQISQCIPKEFYCDGEPDCPGSEDEPDSCFGVGMCSHEQFQCDSGKCIPKRNRCDGELDCRDASDERGCAKECALVCDDLCVHADELCNGQNKCKDGSDEDEEACATKKLLEKKESRKCGGFTCDGIIDCPDGSDEMGCPSLECHLTQNDSRICDGKVDCDSGRDEHNCVSSVDYNNPLFQCSRQTVREWQVCDGRWDCADGLDESPTMCASRIARCSRIGYCNNKKQCLDVSTALCDGIKDCADGSDEMNTCNIMCSNQFRCTNGRCVEMNFWCNGRDDCGDGSDEETCATQCHHFGVCPQKCWMAYNTTARCHCAPGYSRTKSDMLGCEPLSKSIEMFLSNGKMMHLIVVEPSKLLPVFNFKLDLIPGGIDFGYDMFRATLMYTVGAERVDVRTKKWSEGDLVKPWGKETDTSTGGLLAYDFMHNNVYFTESADPAPGVIFNNQENIYVARSGDTKTRTLVVNSTGSITSLAVDPMNRLIFWTTGAPVPRILSAHLDGTPIRQSYKPSSVQPHRPLVERSIFEPKCLVVDEPNERIYWVDGFKRTVETVTLNGKDRRVVRKFELGDAPVAMDLLGSYIYLITNQGVIQKMHKFTGKLYKYTQTVRDISPRIRLRIAHPAKHTVSHITNQNNPCQGDYCPNDTVCIPHEQEDGKLSPKCLCGPGRFFEVSTKKCLRLREKDQEALQCGDYFCYNDAVCSPTLKTCLCKPGFYGKQCEISECSERCWNGETCAVKEHSAIHEIECKCAGNYTNVACATHVCDSVCGPRGACRSVPCPANHPTCRAHTYCQCDEGWTGPQCRDRVNFPLCHGHCFNGGECNGAESQSRLKCKCKPGFSGERCENCVEHECQNGGFCAYVTGRTNRSLSHCICPSGFTGVNCEIYLCKDACPYGSLCFYDVTKPLDPITCSCQENAAAHNSDCSPVCHKEPNWCHNGGVCKDVDGFPGKCKCPPRFKGPRCDIPVPCDDYCVNNSKCTELNGTHYECECQKGFKGARCDQDTKCSECENGAKCVKKVSGTVVCDCPPGLGGNYCEAITAKSCGEISCRNGGYCVEPSDSGNQFAMCLCNPGYGGALCATHACDNFCHHDGECFMDARLDPYCECVGNAFGDRCQYREKSIHFVPESKSWTKTIIIVAIVILTIIVVVGIIANRSNRFTVFRQFRHNPLHNHGAPVDQFSNPAYLIDEGGIELVTQNTSLVSSHERGSFNNPVFEQEMVPIYNDTVENHELLPNRS